MNIPVYPEIVDFISENKKNTFIVTGNLDVWVSQLVASWGCRLLSSQADFKGEKLFGISKIINKGFEVKKLQQTYDKVIAVGDGIADGEMISNADVGIAFGATHMPVTSVIKSSNYVVYDEKTLCRLLKTL
jgi:soluble P-type ATPase